MIYSSKFNRELELSFGMDLSEPFKPKKDSFLYKAFLKNLRFAENSLESGYMQGIKNASLNPDHYGAFMIQDAFYCIEGVKTLEIAIARADCHPQLKKVLELVYKFYNDYVETVILPNWTIKGTESIKVRNGFKAYCALERQIANEKEPIYMLVTLLPCYYLWAWLANELKAYENNNVYGRWIRENQEMMPSILLYDTIETFRRENPMEFNETEALELFGRAMECEWCNFKEA